MRILATLVASSVLAIAASCASDDGTATRSAAPAATATPTATVVATSTQVGPEDSARALGTQIADLYAVMLADLATLLDRETTAAGLAPQLAALRERYIHDFVALGHARESLPLTERALVDSSASSGVFSVEPSLFATMTAASERFRAEGNFELSNAIASMNLLSQYAFFELLKKQLPEEAARLGIE